MPDRARARRRRREINLVNLAAIEVLAVGVLAGCGGSVIIMDNDVMGVAIVGSERAARR